MRLGIVFFILLALSSTVLAQHTVSGKVSDSSGRPLSGATVQWDEGKEVAVTDQWGEFRLSRVPEGSHTLRIRFLGFAEKTVPFTAPLVSPIEIALEESMTITDAVMVQATRANESVPTTFLNVSKQSIEEQNFGQDLPILLNWTPSVVTTSDAGAGIGYTGIRIRGSDATRVNVTLNGIPYNDAESQSTFWVDIPDIASSTQSIQIQRGVGTSTNGAGAFGASINLQTSSLQPDRYADLILAGGSFGTQRYTLRAGTGLLNDHWAFDAKLSRIVSDGYVERASADLGAYYVSGAYYGKSSMVKFIAFGGKERTYQSWYGVDAGTLESNRRMNFAGALYDASGSITGYYSDQADNYTQNHYQVHGSHQFGKQWSATAALHYTYGRGFFEEYHQERAFASVGLPDFVQPDSTYTTSDMVLRKWLDNHFYGGTGSIEYEGEKSTVLLGGAYHRYAPAKHFGEITWAAREGSVAPGYRYYDGRSEKNDANLYIKWAYRLSERWSTFADIQYRGVTYTTSGIRDDQSAYAVDDHFDFLNPKAGVSFAWDSRSTFYASYAIAHREPNRSDYLEGSTKPRPERLNNLEVGFRRSSKRYGIEANYYLMQYTDQLVQTGELDESGYPIRANVGNSFRSGVEVNGSIRISDAWNWTANATWSVNQNKDYVVVENSTTVVRDTRIILSPGIIVGSQLSWKPIAGLETAWLSKYVGEQYLDNTERAAVRMAGYWVNDLRLTYEFAPKGLRSIGFSLLVNNVFDTMYASNGYSYSGVPYYYPQAGRNFMAMMTVGW
jgi:iron complex outermembrane receptor protein